MRLQRQSRHDSQAATATALEPPEQVGIGAGVGDHHLAVGCDDFGLDQAGGGKPEALGEAAEAAALDQACNAYRHAAASLNVAAGFGRRRIGLQPDAASAQ